MIKLIQKMRSKRKFVGHAVVVENATAKINGTPGGAIIEGSYAVWSR